MVRTIGQCQLSDNSRPVGRSGLGLGLGSHVVGRLGSEMRVSASLKKQFAAYVCLTAARRGGYDLRDFVRKGLPFIG